MKHNCGMSGGWRMKHYAEKNTMPTAKHGSGSVMLWGILWHWKPAACRGQDGFNQLWGNTEKKCHAVCEEAGTWASLDLPTQQWSQAYLKVHQGLVSEDVLEDTRVAITVVWLQPHWKSLVGFEKGSCSMQTQEYYWTEGLCLWGMG